MMMTSNSPRRWVGGNNISSGSSNSNNAGYWKLSTIKHQFLSWMSSSMTMMHQLLGEDDGSDSDSSPRSHRRRRIIILLAMFVGIIIIVASVAAAITPKVDDNAAPPYGDLGVVESEVFGELQQQQEEGGEEMDELTKEEEEQKLFHIAEQVVTACAESMLDVDMSTCQHLCRLSMCCFVEESDLYSCVEDSSKHCLVYAACANLMEDFPLDNNTDTNVSGGGGARRRRI